MKFFRNILAGMLAVMMVGNMSAHDLPVKSIKGKDYYCYTVERGETVLSVASKMGVTRDELIKHNPSAADGLRQGAVLYLPVEDAAAATDKSAVEQHKAESNSDATSGSTFSYKVQRGETLFGISHRFGVSPQEIIDLNPDAKTGVKTGQALTIPMRGNSADNAGVEVEEHAAGGEKLVEREEFEGRLRPVTPPVLEVAPGDSVDSNKVAPRELEGRLTPVNPAVEIVIDGDTIAPRKARVALLLPLMLNDTAKLKQARSAVDFVRGFMLGLRNMSDEATPLEVAVCDSKSNPEIADSVLCSVGIDSIDVVIAPDDMASLRVVTDSMASRRGYVLNLFAVQDTTHCTNARVLQANVPQAVMYEKACEALMTIYDGYTPVFLISKGGRSEKINFTDYVRAKYAERAIEPLEARYQGLMSTKDLEAFTSDTVGARYVFIPGSGSLTEFNKFARALRNLRDNSIDKSSIGLFGYPDWTTFRGEAKENLHHLGAVIYSRFYADMEDARVKEFAQTFQLEYGEEMMEQVPSQALLGYDAACYILDNLRRNRGNFDPMDAEAYLGIQSSFLYETEDSDTQGMANQSVYLVTFQPNGDVKVKLF